MITHKEVSDLIKITMVDCPLPSVADMLCVVGLDDDEAKAMFDWLKAHYTREQLSEGIAEYRERVRQMNQLFGCGGAPE